MKLTSGPVHLNSSSVSLNLNKRCHFFLQSKPIRIQLNPQWAICGEQVIGWRLLKAILHFNHKMRLMRPSQMGDAYIFFFNVAFISSDRSSYSNSDLLEALLRVSLRYRGVIKYPFQNFDSQVVEECLLDIYLYRNLFCFLNFLIRCKKPPTKAKSRFWPPKAPPSNQCSPKWMLES